MAVVTMDWVLFFLFQFSEFELFLAFLVEKVSSYRVIGEKAEQRTQFYPSSKQSTHLSRRLVNGDYSYSKCRY